MSVKGVYEFFVKREWAATVAAVGAAALSAEAILNDVSAGAAASDSAGYSWHSLAMLVVGAVVRAGVFSKQGNEVENERTRELTQAGL